MSKWKGNTATKAAVWMLIAALSLVLGWFGSIFLESVPLYEADSWQETSRFYNLLYSDYVKAQGVYDMTLTLDGDVEYVRRQMLEQRLAQIQEELSPQNTWFRYQIKSRDGQTVLFSNLEEGKTLAGVVRKIEYNNFESQGGRLLVMEYGVPQSVTSGTVQDGYTDLAMDWGGSQDTVPLMTRYLAVCVAALLVCIGVLLWMAGHKAGTDGIVLDWQDKIFLEGYLAVMGTVGTAAMVGIICLCDSWYYAFLRLSQEMQDLVRLGGALLVVALVISAVLALRTFAVRWKAHALKRTTLCCVLWGKCWTACKWLWRGCLELVRALPILWRAAVCFAVYLAADFAALLWGRYVGLWLLLWFVLHLGLFVLLCWWVWGFHRLRKGSQAIADGDLNYQVKTDRLPLDLRRYAEDLNNISAGMTRAVEEQMKSERFKSELITNVSHDLKTPLTSIINYVDLLKATEQPDPKAREYIGVLDRKSQRLKKLTEDLVEASKASTGVLKLHREHISMKRLVDQALGEWEEKLLDKGLSVVSRTPQQDCWVYADGRHLWRVLDNLLSNCAKYAMEHTRIYLELSCENKMVTIQVKNISREALNIPSEALMERFVRGEESRTTEGSGLGLSIARSLTQLQGGGFELDIDGDLFKVTVTLPEATM